MYKTHKTRIFDVQEFFQTLPKVASYPAYQHSITRKNFTVLFLKYKRLELKLRVFLW